MRSPIILASASPRRHALLALGGVEFESRPAAVPEIPLPGEQPEAFVRRLSQEKARAVAAQAEAGAVVIGADTVVVLDGEIIGKPGDAAHAAALLRRLRGRTHQVLTGVTAIDTLSGDQHTEVITSRVPMRHYTEAEIASYVASGDPLDKAGAYAIQYSGFQPVDLARFEDCFANVMGLPVCCLLLAVRRLRPEQVPPATRLGDCARYVPGECPVVPALRASVDGGAA